MSMFIKGMDLCGQFFEEAAKPILESHFPALSYSAGLLGYGSDVLGYDDATSTDHMWGPRFYLFLKESDIGLKPNIMETFRKELPYTYKGFSVNFTDPDPNDNGVRHAEIISEGPVSPLIFIHTLNGFLSQYLGVSDIDNLTGLDWLSFSEHRLLALTSGRIFADGLNIQEKLRRLRFYPEDVRLYLLASNWSVIAEEQAFVRRCSDVGDEIGSILICARIADRLMRLAFLYCRTYAPYSKWFGTAFSRLPIDRNIQACISDAITAKDIAGRENAIVRAQQLLAGLHNETGITRYIDTPVQSYFGRDIKVIFADRIAEAIMQRLKGTAFESYPLIGTLSSAANLTNISDNVRRRESVKKLYTT